ncbi:MAG: caspase family protein [Pseudodesulfovibrio sp.]|uniref:caspase family protein n=1 Tax=Pseudodesulfovibrio sp. TaxID=2035812 RepID=UPI003D13F315
MLRAKTFDWVVRAVFLLAALAVCQPAHAAKRVALVIGNGGYASSPLKNPVNDAKDMADKLRGLGFEVTLLTDAGRRKMEDAIHAFDARLGGANVRLFYYAGHGMQVQGANYLIPVDAEVRAERDIKYEAVNAGRVLDGMADAGPGVNILILDACRNNPFARSFRSGSRGLARMDAPSGSMIVYATSPGDVAADGSGRNGIFTKHLLAYVDQSGLTLEQVFKRTGRDVMRETKGDQVPWTASSVFDEVYLSGKTTAAGVSMPDTQPQVAMARVPEQKPQVVVGPPIGDTWTEPTTGMEFVWVPNGCIMLPYSNSKYCSKGFWIGRYEVTQRQWEAIMQYNPSYFKNADNPVEQVSVPEVFEFIERIEKGSASKFMLPKKEEWAYAVNCNDRSINNEKELLKFKANILFGEKPKQIEGTKPVGSYKPNAYGIYDLIGNVREWVSDTKDNYLGRMRVAFSRETVSRSVNEYLAIGGGWFDDENKLEPYIPVNMGEMSKSNMVGFRLIRVQY